ncbi:hypothetical protein C0Q70_00933 [Pomacea canaliculata]|uniref:Uncharacterized protein n=1 Tax=Pomacea canaliculata TaxID=400727 RepID=A0A2T7PY17_POMCA|nr:hypothetical protein C0Q70_00933 [Pomacea canaliculata]
MKADDDKNDKAEIDNRVACPADRRGGGRPSLLALCIGMEPEVSRRQRSHHHHLLLAALRACAGGLIIRNEIRRAGDLSVFLMFESPSE